MVIKYTSDEWYITQLKKNFAYSSWNIAPISDENELYDYLIVENPTIDEINYYIDKQNRGKFIFILSRYNINIINLMYPEHCFIESTDPFLLEKIKQCLKNEKNELHDISITQRERHFLELLCIGTNYSDISYDLNVTDRTVRRIKEKLLNKFGVNSIQQLTVYAIRSGLINIRNT